VWWWVGNIIVQGHKHPLELENLGQLNAWDRTGAVTERFEARLTHYATRKPTVTSSSARPQISRAVLISACVAAERRNLLISGGCKLVGDMLGFVGPLAISGIVTFVTATAAGEPVPSWGGMALGYWWMLAVCAAGTGQCFALQWHHERVVRAGMRCRSALTLLVYRKSLTATVHTLREVGKGQVTNLQSVDADAISAGFWFVHYAWSSPLLIAICMWLLYNQLGASAFTGLAVLICLIPAQAWLGKRIGAHTKSASIAADRRMKLLSEALSGIRIVKLLAYEASFADRIAAARQEELAAKRRVAIVSAANTMLLNAGPMVVALLSFATYGFSGSGGAGVTLTPQQAFSSVTLFAILRMPLMMLPMMVSSLAAAAVSAARLCAFLDAPDAGECRTFHRQPLALAGRIVAPEAAVGTHDASSGAAVAIASTVVPETCISTARVVSQLPSAAPGDHASAEASRLCRGGAPLACAEVWLQHVTLTWSAPAAAARNRTSATTTRDVAAAVAGIAPSAAGARQDAQSADLWEQRGLISQEVQQSGDSGHRQAFQLQDVSLAFPAGGLTQIVGSVGSGKSSLLSAILGEMTLLGGSVNLVAGGPDRAGPNDADGAAAIAVADNPACVTGPGLCGPSVSPQIAYASQQPWLLNASVRDNVTFGLPMQWTRYRRILHACALGPDLAAWPAGDATELGEKGVSCSGGQKARVSLARAIYAATFDPVEGAKGLGSDEDRDVEPLTGVATAASCDASVSVRLFDTVTPPGVVGAPGERASKRLVSVVQHALPSELLQHAAISSTDSHQLAGLASAAAARQPVSIVLLDDVLSAVDAHVAGHIFRHAICGELLGGRVPGVAAPVSPPLSHGAEPAFGSTAPASEAPTGPRSTEVAPQGHSPTQADPPLHRRDASDRPRRHRLSVIMATHQLQFVASSDLIVVMEGGRVAQAGCYADLLAQGGSDTEIVASAAAAPAGAAAVSTKELVVDSEVSLPATEPSSCPSLGREGASSQLPRVNPRGNLFAAMIAERRRTARVLADASAAGAAIVDSPAVDSPGPGAPDADAFAVDSAPPSVDTGLETLTRSRAGNAAGAAPVAGPVGDTSSVVNPVALAADADCVDVSVGDEDIATGIAGPLSRRRSGRLIRRGGSRGFYPAVASRPSPQSAAVTSAPTSAVTSAPASAVPLAPAGKLTVEEDRARGSVSLSLYGRYLGAFGGALLAITAATLLASTVGYVGTDWWLSYWSSAGSTSTTRAGGAGGGDAHSIGYYIGVYAALTLVTIALVFVEALAWAVGGVRAAGHLHAAALQRVLRSPMAFFDATPLGR